ncbi:ATP-binding protein [Streptomyces sp. CG1]|uniref:ATP-binding protein n=1 Tax=Streptomyces sp. CG1 TaxID=1287523 RepID=UPI0034E20237
MRARSIVASKGRSVLVRPRPIGGHVRDDRLGILHRDGAGQFELATNAILHGAPSGELALVRITLADTQLRIEVHDTDDAPPRRRHVPATAETGRGLLLVSALADDWGVEERRGPGKCVWAAFQHSTVPAF